MPAEKQNVVLRCSPGCKPGAYITGFNADEFRHIGYIKNKKGDKNMSCTICGYGFPIADGDAVTLDF